MSLILIVATLTASPHVDESYPSQSQVAAALAGEMQTGTLLFSEGDCLAIRIYTKSRYTHVAAVVVRDGQAFVYDSVNGSGVRRQTLGAYLASQSPDAVHVFQPRRRFSRRRAEVFQEYLDGQLGRPYAIKHYLTGKRAGGVHCSEYVTDALQACNVIRAKQPSRVSPASLLAGIVKANLYIASKTVRLKKPPAPHPKGRGWCEQLWIDTKICTRNCCIKLQRWFLCW